MNRSRFRSPAALGSVLSLSLACVVAAPAARAAGADATQTTEQLAEQAYTLQSEGKFAEAIAVYLKAYETSRDALTLLNIATIYDRKLHERALASEYYRRYAMAPDAEPDRVKKVTERITTLKHEQEDAERAQNAARTAPQPTQAPAAATDTHPASTEAADTSNGTPMRVAGVVVGVVGLLGVGTSFALGYVAKNKNDDANSVCNGSACSSQTGVDMAKSAGDFATGGTIAFVAGLVLVGGGVVLYAAAPKGSGSSSSSSKGAGIFLSPRVDMTGAGLALHGAF
jgi:hypothetical protein